MKSGNYWHDVEVGKEAPKVLNVIIEIPKDSQNKYELDKETGLLKLDRVLYSAVYYPGDYGFVPQTLCGDGDPLDVLILSNRPVYPLTLTEVRILGVMKMIDNNEQDDKLIGVYKSDPRFKQFQSIKDVPNHTLEEIKHFFETYKQLQGKQCKVLEILDKDSAYKEIENAKKLYSQKFKKK